VEEENSRANDRELGRREQTRSHNQALILAAARAVFAEYGYSRTTVRDIIRATPLAAGTFYNYYKSKDEIFQAIRDETALKVRPLLREARSGSKTADKFIYATFRTFFDFVVAEHAALVTGPSSNAMRVRVDTPEIIAGFGELEEDLASAIAAGILPRVDIKYLTASIAGLAFELSENMMDREKPDPEAAARFATDLVLGGISGMAKK